MNENIDILIQSTAKILDRDPLDQTEDTYSILVKFTQALATELGEILVKSPYNEGVLMYFDEKIARYEVKKAVGLDV
jgi:hypothetical protein